MPTAAAPFRITAAVFLPISTRRRGFPTLEVVFTKVNAGGKFGGDSGYKVSSGLHGVGVKAVNALSEWLEAEVFQNGHVYKQVYNRGVPQRVGGGGRGIRTRRARG